jgi:hypothetical protein
VNEQSIQKQIAREYFNVIYGATLNFASLDICEKLPGVISFLSLAIGVLGLSFDGFNNKALATALLIAGIIGLMLKPKEQNKGEFLNSGVELTKLSKKLEALHGFSLATQANEHDVRLELESLQSKHHDIVMPAPVFLSSWYAHYKLFSEHNNKWFCEELSLTFWRDKLPLSFRTVLICSVIVLLICINPFCFISHAWNAITLFYECNQSKT